MRKNIFFTVVIAMLVFAACDYHKDFDGLDELVNKTEAVTFEYTVVNEDFAIIATELKKNKNAADSLTATALSKNKIFSVDYPAMQYLPSLLKVKYPGASKNSAVKVTFAYKNGSTGFYKLTSDNYTQIWDGVSTVGALTPSKPANSIVPDLLAGKYPKALDGDVKIVEYEYSDTEPGQNETVVPQLDENFNSFTTTGTDKYFSDQEDAKAWKGVTETGVLQPDIRAYSGNNYVQFSAHRSSNPDVNAGDLQKMWAVSPAVDIRDGSKLSFETAGGYFNASTVFEVYALDSDNPVTANKTKLEGWHLAETDDIVSGSYTPFMPSGEIDLSDFAGTTQYIGFCYTGTSGSGNSTTYQLDNVNISYTDISTAVSEKETRFGYFKFENAVWSNIDKDFYQLAEEDYQKIGKTEIAVADAPQYLPILLQQKAPYAQSGDIKVMVYKTSATANAADEYVYKDGAWSPVSFVETQTEQYRFSGWDHQAWVFDPSIYVTMKKGIAETDDYMLVT
ncbi:MAG: choice-of-anchor J domain-containing protein, partial [Candidatus Symbiothrix sp.]|nr:choice-of-anchor J domain-containing protein [Candidatus Symbiothrix sp.]